MLFLSMFCNNILNIHSIILISLFKFINIPWVIPGLPEDLKYYGDVYFFEKCFWAENILCLLLEVQYLMMIIIILMKMRMMMMITMIVNM